MARGPASAGNAVVAQGPAAAGDVVVALGLTPWTPLRWHMDLPPLATQWWRKGLSPRATLRWHVHLPPWVRFVVALGLTPWTPLRWHMGLPPLATQWWRKGLCETPWCTSRRRRPRGPASSWVRTWPLPSAAMAWAMGAEARRKAPCGVGRSSRRPRGPASSWARAWPLPSAAKAWALARGAMLDGRSPAQGPVFSWPKPTPSARASVIVGADAAAAVRRDGVGDGTRACRQATLWWPEPVGAGVAAAVCRDGVGVAKRRWVGRSPWVLSQPCRLP
jgi:hypothetical protein